MGVLSRFKDIMSSNINAMLDKVEDPSKMVDQLLRDLNDDLGKVKAETAGVIAEETAARRELNECDAEMQKMQEYAERAVVAGNDQDAKEFLSKRAQLASSQAGLKEAYDLATANANKMRQMHDKLCDQIEELNSRREIIKSKMSVAKTQEKVNKIGSSLDTAKGSLSKFDSMEEKADRMLDKANAMAELNMSTEDKYEERLDNLEDKYDGVPDASSIDDELAALKAKLKPVKNSYTNDDY